MDKQVHRLFSKNIESSFILSELNRLMSKSEKAEI